jgi:hypothetical protein
MKGGSHAEQCTSRRTPRRRSGLERLEKGNPNIVPYLDDADLGDAKLSGADLAGWQCAGASEAQSHEPSHQPLVRARRCVPAVPLRCNRINSGNPVASRFPSLAGRYSIRGSAPDTHHLNPFMSHATSADVTTGCDMDIHASPSRAQVVGNVANCQYDSDNQTDNLGRD